MKTVTLVSRPVQGLRPHPIAFAALAMAIAIISIVAGRAQADITMGASGGVDVSSNVSLLGIVTAGLSVGPQSGIAPNPYSNTGTATGAFSAGSYLLGNVINGTDTLATTTTTSNITGLSTSGMASASTTINNLSLHVLGDLALTPALVSVGATTLTSSASVGGSYGSLTGSASPAITGLAVDVLGLNITPFLNAGGYVDVSTLASEPGLGALASLVGLQIGLDVTSTSGDGISSLLYTSDNLIVNFDGVVTSGVTLNGSIEIGQTQAMIAAVVPEPASVVMLGLGLVAAGVVRTRQLKQGATIRV